MSNNATATISNSLLPPEVWEKVFLSIPSLNDLLRTSSVCREFYRLIRNELFLKKYFRGSSSTLTKDLSVLCNFTSDIAVGSGDFLYNTQDSDTNQPRTHVNGLHLEIGVIDSRPCLIFSSGRSTYMERKCKFNGTDSFTTSFWFLLRNHINTHIQLPLMFIFGHGQQYFLSINFKLTPSCELRLLVGFHDRRRRDDIVIAQQLQTNRWYHNVAVFSLTQSTVKFYLNGNKTNEITMAAQISPDSTVLVRSQYEDGCLADIALWSRELLPMEIQLMSNQITSVDKIDMVKYILNTNNCNEEDQLLATASLESVNNADSFQD